MPNDQPFVSITHAEVWQELRHHELTTGDGGHADHEDRLRKLELRYYALLAGFLTGLSAATIIIARG